MTAWWIVLAGVISGAAVAAVAAVLLAEEPTVRVRNGELTGWVVTRDDETLVCVNPTVFIAAKQIECE